ncbi:MAG: ATP-binding protein [Chloroflexi bacterium]|nr:ATP-binding protein [Chloroflexota bacterium]
MKKKPPAQKTSIVNTRSKQSAKNETDLLQTSTSKLLSKPESTGLDFKRTAESVTSEDLVAFANAGGGVILVGVDEIQGLDGAQKGKAVGCVVSDKEKSRIVNRAKECRPAIPIRVLTEVIRNKSLFRIEIPAGLHCTPNGTYKIRRDGQMGFVDPSEMVKIVVQMKRDELNYYLQDIVQSEVSAIEDRYESLLSDYEDLQSRVDDMESFDRENY